MICLAVPLIVGALAAVLTQESMESFEALNQPPLSPPAWLFPVVWTVLYILMGAASYLILCNCGAFRAQAASALKIYAIQLVVNFFWTIIFFNLKLYLFAFIWLLLLWGLICITIKRFGAISKTAAYLMLPYLIWVSFAGYLNLGIFFLN